MNISGLKQSIMAKQKAKADKKRQKEAAKLQDLRKKRLKEEGDAKLFQMQQKERNRIAKAREARQGGSLKDLLGGGMNNSAGPSQSQKPGKSKKKEQKQEYFASKGMGNVFGK